MRKAIVVASFGTTYDAGRTADIEGIEAAIREAFPANEVRRAFTANFVRKRLAARGLVVDSLAEALDKLAAEGFQEVYVQPALLTRGEEYDNKIMATVSTVLAEKKFARLAVGRPLLAFDGQNSDTNDFLLLAEALRRHMPPLTSPRQAVAFIGHGSPNRHNPAYEKLQATFDDLKLPAVVGVVEETDRPNFEDLNRLLKVRRVASVMLMPLLIVAGDHAHNDMAGPDEASWASRLAKAGYQVSVTVAGLGRNPAIQALFVQHLRDVMSDC